ncbi:MAG: hypothetical protein CVT49_12850 [candidate division Zixibacteria bacterium HGW-Zixibacteria-1]|nr:MAG: hypothetical protein CVT49_12850 [candidate division Zixibacteria bacterium HGW-Zixibacteria-1]
MGAHAVTITGFSLGLPNANPVGEYGFMLRSSKINEIYAHDDQIGPFARMIFDGETIEIDGEIHKSLRTSWRDKEDTGPIGSGRAIPHVLYIPLYHKVRIPYSTIHDNVNNLNTLIEVFRLAKKIHLTCSLDWDIYLTSVNSLKEEVFKSTLLEENKKLQCLLERMPRFIWRAIAMEGANPVLEFLFDATDIEQGPLMTCTIEYDDKIAAVMREVSKEMSLHPEYQSASIWPIIEYFSK